MSPRLEPRSILGPWSPCDPPGAARARRHRRPAVEPMESRRLLSTVTEFPVPTATADPDGIATGSDGQIWFTEFNKIGSIDPSTHQIAEYPIPTTNTELMGIAAGPDGKLWFTELAGNIGMLDPITHHIFEYAIPTAKSVPNGIAAGPDGTLWFTESLGDKIGSIDPYTHAIVEYPIPTSGAFPQGIAAGPDGKLWFTEFFGNQIGSIDPKTGQIAEYAIPTASSEPSRIAAGPDGDLWFTETNIGRIGSIDPSTHSIHEYIIPSANSQPDGIAAGPDGNLWFAETEADEIGRIDPSTHSIAESFLPNDNSQPRGIAAGPDGNLWFAESAGNKIGVIVPPLALSINAGSPALVAEGAAFGLTVSVAYASGAPDTGFDGDVTLALADPGGATLGGTTTIAARHGVARFAGLAVDRPGTYRIVASLDTQTTATTTVTVDPPPTIVAEAPVLAGRGRHKRLAGFELDFSAAMDPNGAASTASYSLVQFQRRRHRLIARPVTVVASYDAATHRVTLTLLGRPKFAAGGELVVDPAGGLVDAAGTPMGGAGATFAIAPKGRGLSR